MKPPSSQERAQQNVLIVLAILIAIFITGFLMQ